MIGQRAQAGAKMLYELINEHSGPSTPGPADTKNAAAQDSRGVREQIAARGERR
jgi:hypothetical protein